jgi:hypothetical protein
VAEERWSQRGRGMASRSLKPILVGLAIEVFAVVVALSRSPTPYFPIVMGVVGLVVAGVGLRG